MNISRRHHYIPKFYIKGFVGIDGKVSVYNKETGMLDPNRKSPKQVFFEWNRNTQIINGEETDVIEKLYQFAEDKFSPTYRKLNEKLEEIDLTPLDLLELILFISEIYWRIPVQDDEILNQIKILKQENSIFEIKNRESNENVSEDIFNKFKNEPLFIESFKIIKSIQDYFGVKKDESLKNWKLYYSPKENNHPHLLCDNPLITNNSKKHNILQTELIFPLSKSKIIFHTNGKILKELPPENRVLTDILLFLQAEKMVCGPDESYIKTIAELAKAYDTDRKVELLKSSLFEIF